MKANRGGEGIEWIARTLMASILLTAGTSKLYSAGEFAAYYGDLFQGELRIRVPRELIDSYLTIIPFIELSLGSALLIKRWKPYTIYGWYGFMFSLVIGHYILEEWSVVNQMLDYFFLGMLCHALPVTKSRKPLVPIK